jgi:hypothetical protein
MRIFLALLISSCLGASAAWAQVDQEPLPFSDIQIQIDTAYFSLQRDALDLHGRQYLRFKYQEEQTVAEFLFYPRRPYGVKRMEILPSIDYDQIDSLIYVGNRYFRARLLFPSLSQSQTPTLQARLYYTNSDTIDTVIPLFPVSDPEVSLFPGEKVLFIGEERIFPLQTPLPSNIRPIPNWRKTASAAYRITLKDGQPQLHLIPLEFGSQTLSLPFQSYRPSADESDNLTYEHYIEPFDIQVKRGRLQFVALSNDIFELGKNDREATRRVNFNRQLALSLKRTYRIEDRETLGGRLIAELYVEDMLSNTDMQARLRLYDYHLRSEGPLFIKAQDETLLKTNFDVIFPPNVLEVAIRPQDSTWTEALSLRPGESFDLRLRGESLQRARYLLEDLENLGKSDSVSRTEELLFKDLKIPEGTKAREIRLMQDDIYTGFSLKIREFRRAHPLDYVQLHLNADTLDWEGLPRTRSIFTSLSRLQLQFRRDSIEQDYPFFGPQYLRVEVEVTDDKGLLLAPQKVKEICLCPEETTPRAEAYQRFPCYQGPVALEKLIDRPLSDLPAYTQVYVTLAHQDSAYQQNKARKQIRIVLRKKYKFGFEATFPVGIIMKRFNVAGSEPLQAVGFAAMAQLAFYRRYALNELKPFRISAGMMSIDVFPLDGDAPLRDWGISAFMSLYPIDSQKRWNIPLYLGGGYLIEGKSAFFFFGPGFTLQL